MPMTTETLVSQLEWKLIALGKKGTVPRGLMVIRDSGRDPGGFGAFFLDQIPRVEAATVLGSFRGVPVYGDREALGWMISAIAQEQAREMGLPGSRVRRLVRGGRGRP